MSILYISGEIYYDNRNGDIFVLMSISSPVLRIPLKVSKVRKVSVIERHLAKISEKW